ncbi:type II secretion system F family protein [Ralstonia solanacearum]|uniref:type II secretion system F family protein n=1 Tax=Ralstonia solanacearum TaxID=305 RepID=UPI0001D98337|nr:type II secretion system F family protein [Ralstonia solanacearum]CBJ52066.1 Tad secretion system, pilus assembly protein [Ralstonia solanacearum PSI07]
MNPSLVGFAASLFIAVVLGAIGFYLWWNSRHSPTAKRLNQRLEMALFSLSGKDAQTSILKQRVLAESTDIARLLQRIPHVNALDMTLLQSGLDWSVSRFLTLTLALPVVACTVAALFAPPLVLLLGIAALAGALPTLYLARCRARRLRKLEAQLPEATDLLARALRAGHSFPSALDMAGSELPAPIASEFALVFSEINYGVPMGEALAAFSRRVPIEDLRFLVIAVLIQRESGGNLAEILDNIGTLIRKRLQLLDKIRVLSAEGRLGGWILSLMPPVLGVLMYFLNPTLVSSLWTHPLGIQLLWAAIIMTGVGMLWIRHLVRIHV